MPDRSRYIKPLRELTIMDDFMFGVVMQDKALCKPLLEILLGFPIREIQYVALQDSIKPDYGAKGVRLDVFAEDDQNTVYDIEVQVMNKHDIPKRARYYHSLIDLNLLNAGKSYHELRKSYVIFICPFDPFDEGRSIYSFENTCREMPSLPLNDGAHTVIVNTKGKRGSTGRDFDALMQYFNAGEAQTDFTRQIDSAVQHVKNRKETEVAYMTLAVRLMDERWEGRQEGREEGREEGRREAAEQARKENIRNMFVLLKQYVSEETAVRQIAQQLKVTEESVRETLEEKE